MLTDHNINLLGRDEIGAQLDAEGFCLLPGLVDAESIISLKSVIETRASAMDMSSRSADVKSGGLFYFDSALPVLLSHWRTLFYRHLAVIANRWNETLGIDDRYPAEFEDFRQSNCELNQKREQSYLNRLGVEGHMHLHQRATGEQIFPLQIVSLLSQPGVEFTGGEFVMTEQRPRMQSRPIVLPLRFGDAAIIATAQRPFKGAKGYYRVNLKHAISRVRSGERIGLELSFHNAP